MRRRIWWLRRIWYEIRFRLAPREEYAFQVGPDQHWVCLLLTQGEVEALEGAGARLSPVG